MIKMKLHTSFSSLLGLSFRSCANTKNWKLNVQYWSSKCTANCMPKFWKQYTLPVLKSLSVSRFSFHFSKNVIFYPHIGVCKQKRFFLMIIWAKMCRISKMPDFGEMIHTSILVEISLHTILYFCSVTRTVIKYRLLKR